MLAAFLAVFSAVYFRADTTLVDVMTLATEPAAVAVPTAAATPTVARRRARRVDERGVVSDIERARWSLRWSLRGVHGLLLVFLARRRPRAAAVAGQGVGEHRRRTPCASRWACARAASTWRTFRRPGRTPRSATTSSTLSRWRSAHGSSSSSSPSPAATCSASSSPGTPVRRRRSCVATLFIPPVVLLVPLFLTVLDLPIVGAFAAQQLLGRLAAGRRQRLQRAARQALLREPARAS